MSTAQLCSQHISVHILPMPTTDLCICLKSNPHSPHLLSACTCTQKSSAQLSLPHVPALTWPLSTFAVSMNFYHMPTAYFTLGHLPAVKGPFLTSIPTGACTHKTTANLCSLHILAITCPQPTYTLCIFLNPHAKFPPSFPI